MAIQRTFSIIKPDATRRNLTGAINAMLEKGGLRIVAQKRLHLSRAQAEAFYGVHKERPFFNSLCDFMTSGPIVAQVLEGEDAVARNREIMGATNPANAEEGPSKPGCAVRNTFDSRPSARHRQSRRRIWRSLSKNTHRLANRCA